MHDERDMGYLLAEPLWTLSPLALLIEERSVVSKEDDHRILVQTQILNRFQNLA